MYKNNATRMCLHIAGGERPYALRAYAGRRGVCAQRIATRKQLHLREQGDALGDVFVGGDEVGHFAVVELPVGDHVEVAGAGEAEDDVFGFAGFFALEGLVDGGLDGV